MDEIDPELLDVVHKEEKQPVYEEKQKYAVSNKVTFAPKAAAAAPSVNYTAGQRVKHSKFGEGMIIKATPMGNDWHLEIAFDSVGTKILWRRMHA